MIFAAGDHLHLRPVPDAPKADVPTTAESVSAVYFVLQRQNGHWSPAAKIMQACTTEAEAELEAEKLKTIHPHQHFGVAALRSEARVVPKPVEIVRVPDGAS